MHCSDPLSPDVPEVLPVTRELWTSPFPESKICAEKFPEGLILAKNFPGKIRDF
jgi:hypothetical protein